MDTNDKKLLIKIYDNFFKPKLPAQVSGDLTQSTIDGQTKTLSAWYAVVDVFLGACGIGVPVAKPWVNVSDISLTDPQSIQPSELSFPEGGDYIDLSITIGSFMMDGRWEFGQKCVQFYPSNVCATTSVMKGLGEAHGIDISSDVNLDFLREFRDEVSKYKKGSEYVQKYYDNEAEVKNFLDTNDEVKKVFTDNDALDLLNNVIEMVQGLSDAPLDEDKMENALMKMVQVLMQYGSMQLVEALMYAKQELPQYYGMTKDQILSKLAESGPASESAKEAKAAAAAEPAPGDNPIYGTRKKDGSFTDTIKDSTITIKGKLDFSGDKPVFSLRSTDAPTGITATVGDVNVDVDVNLDDGTTPAQAIGDLLAVLLGEWFGPGVTKDQILDYFQGQDFADKITTMMNDSINENWPF